MGEKSDLEEQKIDHKFMNTKLEAHMTFMKHKGRFDRFRKEFTPIIKNLEASNNNGLL